MFGKHHNITTKSKIGEKSKNKKGNYKKETIEKFRIRMIGTKNPRYGKKFKHKKESLHKIRKTMEERGRWFKRCLLSDFLIYRREVNKFTDISVKEKFKPEELKNRGKFKNINTQVDHIFSVANGFKENILPMIIGCKGNLRIISVSENCSKYTRSDITKEELFDIFIKEINNENVECSC